MTDVGYQITNELADKLSAAGLDIDMHITSATKDVIDLMHEKGIGINVWTCDSQDKAEELVELGVDYITSNILE